ncbi:hypothetical protein DENSPDRAFT_376023 [Dentipellis sp. KUC8613]|nr:hypothetical protein DENSPDRAFT_376023 [Dentipellis sp. KUC8613]
MSRVSARRVDAHAAGMHVAHNFDAYMRAIMDSSSDTESESGNSACFSESVDFTDAANPTLDSAPSRPDLQEAIQVFIDMNAQFPTRNPCDHRLLHEASLTILSFLDNIDQQTRDPHENISAFCDLASDTMLSKLFGYRMVLQSMASMESTSGNSPSLAVCLVDMILAKLGDATVVIAGIAGHCTSNSIPVNSLTSQRKKGDVRTAASLPRLWCNVPTLLVSDTASPAILRLALRLVFAVHVMRPLLMGLPSPLTTMFDSNQASKMIHIYTARFAMPDLEASKANSPANLSSDLSMQSRTTFAMLVAVLSVIIPSGKGANNNDSVAQLRPYMLSSLLSIIQAVMHPSLKPREVQPLLPLVTLDPAQTIMLRWSSLMSWCWVLWDNPRCAGVETIWSLTTTWLYHLEPDLSGELTGSDAPWEVVLFDALADNPTAAGVCLLQLLDYCTTTLVSNTDGLPQTTLNVIYKMCWATVQFCNPSHSLHAPLMRNSVKYLCVIYVTCKDALCDRLIQNVIVEGLSWLSTVTFQDAMEDLLRTTSLSFFENLDQCLESARW